MCIRIHKPEYMTGGELFKHLRTQAEKNNDGLSEEDGRFYGGQMAMALQYLHHLGILYRDLKPENILLDIHGYIKIVDFGFAKRIAKDGTTWTICGTPDYLAPEIIAGDGYNQVW